MLPWCNDRPSNCHVMGGVVGKIEWCQEKMRGQRGRLPVQPLGYVMSTKVIFRRAEVFVLVEDVRMRANLRLMFERKAKISCNGGRSGLNVCR